ncbi:MAG TPA: inositol monophosphatase [Gammaproteobacteria bacterium]
MNRLPAIAEVASLVVAAAREELLPRFRQVSFTRKADDSLLTEADVAMQQRLAHKFNTRWPHLAFLGEEMPEALQQGLLANDTQGVWIVDPLDGTRNFAAGLPFFSVSVALLLKGEVVLGLVYDPIRDECFSAVKGEGAQCNGVPLQLVVFPHELRQTIALIDFKRLSPQLASRLVTERPFSSQRSFGSVAIDWCWLAAGRCHTYLHGAQRLWDYAAGTLIYTEMGGRAVTLRGEPLFNGTLEPRSAVAALDGQLFHDWCRWLGVAD